MGRRTIHKADYYCGQCNDYVCPRRFCWCPGKRDPIVGVEPECPSPVTDMSDGSMWRDEVDILRVLWDCREAGKESPLAESRAYAPDVDTYCVSWYWTNTEQYHRQWDGPVIRLWSRGLIRPVRCAGGYTWVVLTDRAVELIRSKLADVSPTPAGT